jgi:putative tryptophan/tyrosine transport system substrate-binding protein
MRRREFITLLGGAAANWPLATRAQQSERVRRIAVLYGVSETDLEGQAWDAAFRKRLAELGWIDGRNFRVENRWTGGNLDRTKLFANELVQTSPDVLVAVTTPATAALQRETQTIPIVFTSVSDPVGSGFVASLRKPGGNITGFINMEASLGGKWVGLIHEIAPFVSRMAILFNPQTAPFAKYYLDTFRSAATAFSVDTIEAAVHSKRKLRLS